MSRADVRANPRAFIPPPLPEQAAHYRRSGAWLDLTAGDALRRSARERPDKTALVEGESRISFRSWDEASERLGVALLAQGLEPGDRVLFQMGSTIETAVALFACFKAALIPVCALPQYRELEIGTLARMTDARVVAMPDPAYGEKACAYLILRPDASCPDVAALGAFLVAQGLARFKCPERVETTEVFPVTRVGKVDKGVLRAMIAASLAAEASDG